MILLLIFVNAKCQVSFVVSFQPNISANIDLNPETPSVKTLHNFSQQNNQFGKTLRLLLFSAATQQREAEQKLVESHFQRKESGCGGRI